MTCPIGTRKARNRFTSTLLTMAIMVSMLALAVGSTAVAQDATQVVYTNDFSNPADVHRLDHFVQYRDQFVIRHTSGASDHATTGGQDCTAPEQTRSQSRERPEEHVYLCHPGGDPALGHMMSYAMDTSGYGWVGGLPDQVFEGVTDVSVDINATSAGVRNFIEIKILPAAATFANAMPCGPALPCNDDWDYDDVDGVAAFTESAEGTALAIATQARPDGYFFDQFNAYTDATGDVYYRSCDENTTGYCFRASTHQTTTGIRARYRHTFRDNGDGTLSFGIEDAGTMHWVTAPGSFPDGPVRVVIAFHNYTGTKDRSGPGFEGNVSPSVGGFTWHWDNLEVAATSATPSEEFFGGNTADRIVTPDGCIAFAQGRRNNPHPSDIEPEFRCVPVTTPPPPTATPRPPTPTPPPPTATPTPPPLESVVVYDEGFASGWNTPSWSIDSSTERVRFAHSGRLALAMTFTQNWGGYFLLADDPISPSDVASVGLWVHGGVDGLDQVAVSAVNLRGEWGTMIPISSPARTWTRVDLPLSDFNLSGPLRGLVFHERGGTVGSKFYLDEIVLFPAR